MFSVDHSFFVAFLTYCLYLFVQTVVNPSDGSGGGGESGQGSNEIKSMLFDMHLKLNNIEAATGFQVTEITPSSACKSSNSKHFEALTTGLGFQIGKLADKVLDFEEHPQIDWKNFVFHWNAKRASDGAPATKEEDSYKPLVKYLQNVSNLKAFVVASGDHLYNGRLFEQDVHTLKEDISVSSFELRKTGAQPRKIITIKGRTDVVIIDPNQDLCRSSVLIAIEVKPGKFTDFTLEAGLREIFVQLIGLNTANPFHSPAVLLTNLVESHYLMFLEATGNLPRLKFKLKILKFSQLNHSLAHALKLSQRDCITKHFGAPPTPQTSEKTSEKSEEEEEEENFGNVQLGAASDGID